MTNEMREINEAIQAGERALTSLRKAEEKLTSAGNWGLWDIFGGGLISGIAKHNKMNEASSYMEEAKRNKRCHSVSFRCIGTVKSKNGVTKGEERCFLQADLKLCFL